jgi:hypothetical protein
MHGPATPEEHLERRYLWDKSTALGRLFAAYEKSAFIKGMDALEFGEMLSAAIREAVGLPDYNPFAGG